MRATRNLIRHTQTYELKTGWFDWLFTRILWPCLVVSVGGVLAYYALMNLLKVQEWLEAVVR